VLVAAVVSPRSDDVRWPRRRFGAACVAGRPELRRRASRCHAARFLATKGSLLEIFRRMAEQSLATLAAAVKAAMPSYTQPASCSVNG